VPSIDFFVDFIKLRAGFLVFKNFFFAPQSLELGQVEAVQIFTIFQFKTTQKCYAILPQN